MYVYVDPTRMEKKVREVENIRAFKEFMIVLESVRYAKEMRHANVVRHLSSYHTWRHLTDT